MNPPVFSVIKKRHELGMTEENSDDNILTENSLNTSLFTVLELKLEFIFKFNLNYILLLQL